jgi:iron complex transport system permease protein
MIKETFMSRNIIIFILIGFLVFILFVANLLWGSVSIPLSHIWEIISKGSSSDIVSTNIILRTRLPQSIVALGAGMALGIAGLMLQTLFKNPLAGPSVLGISSGASLGVAFVVLFAGNAFGIAFSQLELLGELVIILASLFGATAILLLILSISLKLPGTLSVLIIGVMIGYLTNSLVGIFKYFSLESDLHSFVIWGLGSFNRLSLERAMLFGLLSIIPSFFMLLMSKPLNLIALGDNYARNLGLRTTQSRFVIIMAAGYLTAIVTAFCGPIAFIGMAVPHLTKLIIRTGSHLHLIMGTILLGGATALLCNLAARLPGLDSTLPINSVTAFVGAPVVISIVLKRKMQ